MKLVHTLLLLYRDNNQEDGQMLKNCLKSLEKSTYKTVVVYNQGTLTDDRVKGRTCGV